MPRPDSKRKGRSASARPRRRPAAGADEDARLLERIAAGDEEAFEALYHRYHRRLAGYLHRFLGTPERRADVDEVLDDVMMTVWERAGRFDGRSQPSTWLFGIAYHKALKSLERSRRRNEREEELADPSSTNGAGEATPGRVRTAPGPEAATSRRELRRRLRRAMAEALSPEQRAAVELTFFYGHSYREIAEIVGCPVNTVKTRMFHARRLLKERLAHMGIDGEAI